MVTNKRTNDEQPGEPSASPLVDSEQSWLLQYEVWASAISLLQLTQSVVLEGKYVQKLSFDLQASDRQMYKKDKIESLWSSSSECIK